MQCRVEWSRGHSGVLVTCCWSSCRESIGVYFLVGEQRVRAGRHYVVCARGHGPRKRCGHGDLCLLPFWWTKKRASKFTTGVCMSHTRVAHRQTTHTPVLHAVFFKPRVVDLWSSATSHIDKISQILIFTIEIKFVPHLKVSFTLLVYPYLLSSFLFYCFPFLDYALRHPSQLLKSSHFFFFQLRHFPELMLSINDFKVLRVFVLYGLYLYVLNTLSGTKHKTQNMVLIRVKYKW